MNQPTIKQMLAIHRTSANNTITVEIIVYFCLIVNNIGQDIADWVSNSELQTPTQNAKRTYKDGTIIAVAEAI